MGEDKLTAAQRVRLEAFAQALNSSHVVWIGTPATLQANHASNVVSPQFGDPPRPTMDDVFARAELIEAWLLKAQG